MISLVVAAKVLMIITNGGHIAVSTQIVDSRECAMARSINKQNDSATNYINIRCIAIEPQEIAITDEESK